MVKIFFSKDKKQARVTIPLTIARAMQLEHGEEIDFIFNGKHWEIIKRKKESGGESNE